ncbi:glucan endo-1,3-beta-glucosidase 11-like [Panicum miliaceum]|uniref:Glucan endo-1,3-beta-glucosidase 11-like n=1 Tax=Panicum miliaceum TaxID=4540 RepID=A0A3L6S845_PANMI|nr:glucan endo-1,3-beta-glucosidase 11-like [Panicum miliaceum]
MSNPQVLSAFAEQGHRPHRHGLTVYDGLVPDLAASSSQALQEPIAGVRPYFQGHARDQRRRGQRGVNAALVQLGTNAHVRVPTASSLAVLAASYPPAARTTRSTDGPAVGWPYPCPGPWTVAQSARDVLEDWKRAATKIPRVLDRRDRRRPLLHDPVINPT